MSAPMTELVRDHLLDERRRMFQDRVEQDHPPSRPEPAHIRVVATRAATLVGDEHAGDGYPGPVGHHLYATGEVHITQWLEAIEDGRDQHREEEAEHDTEGRDEHPSDQ